MKLKVLYWVKYWRFDSKVRYSGPYDKKAKAEAKEKKLKLAGYITSIEIS